jgi:TPP-dependent pyruvate/acetoin dehydrogenase alpha subunit
VDSVASVAPNAPAAYENPLIPNARLRQLYAAILHARLLGESLPPAPRRLARGLEAALVSTSADLAANDLVSDALTTPVLNHLRAATFAESPPSHAAPPLKPKARAALVAWATPATLPPSPAIAERIHQSLGAASALKAAHAKSRTYTNAKGGTPRQQGVVVLYALPGEVSTTLWKKALAFAAQHELPIVFVVLPPPRTARNLPKAPARLNPVIAIALRNHVPGIIVDANDPVALYRVAQESIGRARSGGGPALIECVPFLLHGSRLPPQDALPALERYLLLRGAASRAWLDRTAREALARTRRLTSKKR